MDNEPPGRREIEASRNFDMERNYYNMYGVVGDDDVYGRMFGRAGTLGFNWNSFYGGYWVSTETTSYSPGRATSLDPSPEGTTTTTTSRFWVWDSGEVQQTRGTPGPPNKGDDTFFGKIGEGFKSLFWMMGVYDPESSDGFTVIGQGTSEHIKGRNGNSSSQMLDASGFQNLKVRDNGDPFLEGYSSAGDLIQLFNPESSLGKISNDRH